MIRLSNISKSYRSVRALDDVTFRIKKNETIGIIGPNGSGKSTLIKIITGLLKNYKGEVQYEDLKVTDISLASEEFGFPSYYSVRKIIRIFANLKGIPEKDFFRQAQVLGLEKHLDKTVKQLSQGLKQRLNILVAISGDSSLIIFDEPNNGLDPGGFRLLRRLIADLQQAGRSVIIASHLLGELEQTCDRLLFLKNGQVVEDRPMPDLKETFGTVEQAYYHYFES